MREQLIQYVSLLFAGADGCEDVKTEILQNTLDRYDDLVAEGKSPEAAYRLAIVGIGDINEILAQTSTAVPAGPRATEEQTESPTRSLLRAIGIGLYILCPTPLFILSGMGMPTFGLCGTLFLVAAATVLMVLTAKKQTGPTPMEKQEVYSTPEQKLRKSIRSAVDAIGLTIYFIISFATDAWFITWLIFPIMGAAKEMIMAIMDLKEEKNHV